jgi:hypothetical protein
MKYTVKAMWGVKVVEEYKTNNLISALYKFYMMYIDGITVSHKTLQVK